jgi:hypothetical protein
MLVTYSGGPIVHCSLIHTSFWGPAWGDALHTGVANQLNQFHQDYVASQAMNVITQYGVIGGVYSSASYLNWVPGTLDPTSIQSIIQGCIDSGAFPEPGDPATQQTIPILVVYLDENTIINGGGRSVNFPGAADYGYHDSFTTTAGDPFIYAFSGWFDINFTTVVASHEYAEMITDPLYNAWTPDGGYHEIGDYCEGSNDAITISGRTWTIQQVWSDVDNSCRGTAPNPIPAISPGPGGAAIAGFVGVESRGRGPRPRGPAQHLPFERLLPLPPRHIDKDFNVTTREEDQNHYLNRLFHPLRHEHVFADFPRFLREAADFVERRPRGGPSRHIAEGPAPPPKGRGGVRTRPS